MELIHAQVRHFYLNNLSLLGINLKTIVSNYGNKKTKEKKPNRQTYWDQFLAYLHLLCGATAEFISRL